MKMKEEPSVYFFDEYKDASYYKNRFLNNCKSRNRNIRKLYNSFMSCKVTLDQIMELENKKDPLASKDTDKLEELEKNIDSCIEILQEFNDHVNTETQELLTRNFEDILTKNVQKVKDIENEKGCEEITKK